MGSTDTLWIILATHHLYVRYIAEILPRYWWNKVIWLYQLSWKCKLATVTCYKADVSSVSPSSFTHSLLHHLPWAILFTKQLMKRKGSTQVLFNYFLPIWGLSLQKFLQILIKFFIYLSHFTILNSVNSFHQMSIFCQLDTVWRHTRRPYQKSVYYLHEGLFDFIYFLVNFFCLDIYFLLTNFHENLQQWRRWYW